MGSCYVAATSPVAHAISLEDAMPKDGFRYIKYSRSRPTMTMIRIVMSFPQVPHSQGLSRPSIGCWSHGLHYSREEYGPNQQDLCLSRWLCELSTTLSFPSIH
jgi:hypothetical protein